MPESFVAVVSRGRITIDLEVRELLDIKDGDYVRASVEKASNKEAL